MADDRRGKPSELQLDLLVAIIVSVAAPLIVTLWESGTAARFIIGLPYLFLVPGWALASTIWSSKGDLPMSERVAYSIGLSVLISGLAGIALSGFSAFEAANLLIALSATTIAIAFLAWFRRIGAGKDGTAFQVTPDTLSRMWHADGGRTTLIAAVAALVAVSIMLSFVIVNLDREAPSTRFYALGSDGTLASLPKNMTVGEIQNITLVFENHEGMEISYEIRMTVNGTSSASNYTLASVSGAADDGDESRETVGLAFADADRYRVSFSLYYEGESEPAYFLHIWISVA